MTTPLERERMDIADERDARDAARALLYLTRALLIITDDAALVELIERHNPHPLVADAAGLSGDGQKYRESLCDYVTRWHDRIDRVVPKHYRP